jgi:hypothetical protein
LLGAILTSRYNGYLSDGVLAIKDPSYPGVARNAAINGIEKGAGTIGGSTGLRGPQAAPYVHQPHFADLQHVAHTAFINGEIDILRVAAVILAIGALAGLFLIRPQDMHHEEALAGAWNQEGAGTWQDAAAQQVPQPSPVG